MPSALARRWASIAVIGTAFVVSPTAPAASDAARIRPHIILIMADDLGFSDLGSFGSEISTPNLDRLASGGMRLTQFYNCARCCPTRAALLTGLYPHQAGIGHMVGNRGIPAYQGYLNDRCVTIAEALRAGGYRTYMAGKWHVGEARPHWPLDRGFERFYGLISGASSYFETSAGRVMARDNEPFQAKPDGFYLTDAISENAAAFIRDHGASEAPFFLYVAYTSPHWPLHAPAETIAKYVGRYRDGWDALRERRRKRMIELSIIDAKWDLTPRDGAVPAWPDAPDKEWEDRRMAVYAAQIDRMDQGIGKILEAIRSIGAEGRTLVLFLADNGGCAEVLGGNDPKRMPGGNDTFMSYGIGWANASNTPFRLYKHWVHEGGISSPFIAYWPGTIPAGKIGRDPAHVIDILPTCLDAAGVEYPATYGGRSIAPVEGKSLLAVLRGGSRPGHEAIFWEHEGNRAIRQGTWKLVARHGKPWELFDLESDRSELNDLAASQPDRVRAMAARWEAWAKRAGVVPWESFQAPAKKKDANPSRSPDLAFDRHIVCPNVPGADEVACGDIDGDGRIDILASQSEGEQLPIRWFRNEGGSPPRWRAMERISPVHADWKGEQGWMGSWLIDVDGDGDLDAVSGAKGNFGGVSRPLCWFENAKGDGTRWVEHRLPVDGDIIDNTRAGDLDGDGRPDIVAQKYHGGGVYLLTRSAVEDPRATKSWRALRIGGGGSGLSLADIDRDGRLDVLVDNQWFRNPGPPAREDWPRFVLPDAPGGVKNAAGDLDGDGRPDIVLASEEGRGIWWFAAPADPAKGGWVKHSLAETREGNHTLWLADFDGDARLDILTAEMHTRGRHRVTIFLNGGAGKTWVERTIATTGSHNAIATDIDGDGRPDIAGCNFAERDNPIDLWIRR